MTECPGMNVVEEVKDVSKLKAHLVKFWAFLKLKASVMVMIKTHLDPK